MTTAEQFSALQKSNFETVFSLGGKVFSSVEKFTELNLQAAKALLSEAHETVQAAFSVKDLQGLIAIQADWLKSAAEKAAAYRHHLNEIATSTSAELIQAAESQTKQAQDKFLADVDAASKNGPAGSNAADMVKAGFEGANKAYDGMKKAAKEATDATEANLSNAADSALKYSQSAVNKAKRVDA